MPRDGEPAGKRDPSALFGFSQRLPPANIEAEQALLGAILSNNRAYERVAEFLEPHHFSDPVHGRIYREISELILDGRLANAVTLKRALEHAGVLDEVGGTSYLADLLTAMVGTLSAAEYGSAIVDCWKRRALIEIGEQVINTAFAPAARQSVEDQIDEAERALSDLSDAKDKGVRVVTGGAAIKAAVAIAEEAHRSGKPPGVIFGIPTVDRALDGLVAPGTLTIIGGLPGSGKTGLVGQMGKSLGMLALQAGLEIGEQPARAARRPGMLIMSMEMSAEELGLRLAADECGMTVDDLRKGRLDMESTLRIKDALERTEHMAFRIADLPGRSLAYLGPKIRMLLQRQLEEVVVVDNIMVAAKAAGEENKRGRGFDMGAVAQVTLGLKRLAKQLGVAIIALHHTPRPKEENGTRRPRASDLKFAGEDDADSVVFVHRPIMLMDSSPPARSTRESEESYARRRERWHQERDSVADLAELVVAKQRMGPGGVFRMRWNGPTTTLREWGPGDAKIPEWVVGE